jgi:hypothetical protein
MSQPTPYEQLGINESASFEEIQAAKHRLQSEHGNDSQLTESIEAAYDSILMERLKLRQEGKINIPEGIRFPEKSVQTLSLPKLSPPQLGSAKELIEMPDTRSLAIGSGVMGLLAIGAALPATALSSLPTLMVVAIGFTVFSLRAKSNRLGRAFLITGLALLGTIGLTTLAINLTGFSSEIFGGERIAALATVVVMWLLTIFVK